MISNANYVEMDSERISLWPGKAPIDKEISETANVFLTVHRPAKANGTALIICPGGGYGGLVKGPEGSGIAKWLNAHGIVGIVLEYRLPEGKPYRPLFDVQRAIRIARSKASEWKCNPKRIGIIGFSAGGHLASTSATHFNYEDSSPEDSLKEISCRPDFTILIYPLITMGAGTHKESKNNLLGNKPNEEMITLFSNEVQVTTKTPPTFLAHAMDDCVALPRNSALFYDALLANNVPATYLKLPSGGHGLDRYTGPMWEEWQTQSLQWLSSL